MHNGVLSPIPRDSQEALPHGRRLGTRTRLSHEAIVTGSLADSLWAEYYDAFAPFEELALLCHLYSRETFDALLQDRDIVKIVGWQDERPVGLSMVTNHLEHVPQISPKFLRLRFPAQAERNSIYFAIVLFIAPQLRGRTLFARLGVATCQVAAIGGGVLAMDVSQHVLTSQNWDSKLQTMASVYRGAEVARIDTQSYWSITLPEPLPDDFRLAAPRHAG